MDTYRTSDGPVAIPEPVRRLAMDRRLGEPLDVRTERTTGALVGGGLALFAVGLVLSFAIAAYNSAQYAAAYSGSGTSHNFFAPTGAAVVLGIVLAIRGLVVGTRVHYLYSGGLVSMSRGGPRALAWNDVAVLKTVYDNRRGNIAGYRAVGSTNLTITIPLRLVDGRDAFIDGVMSFLRQNGRPIH